MARHAYLVSPTAAVIAAVMGAALTVWPPETPEGKTLWVVGFTFIGLLAVIGTIADRRVSERSQEQRDAQVEARHHALHQETRALIAEPSQEILGGIRAVTEQATVRNRVLQLSARELASEMRDFFILFDRERPMVNVTLAGTAQHMEFIKQIQDTNDHDRRLAEMAADRFNERLKLTVIDLRNSGVLDANTAAEAFYKVEHTVAFRQLVAAIEKAADLL